MPIDVTSRYRGAPTFEVDDPSRGPQPTVAIRTPTGLLPGTVYRHVVVAPEDIEYLAWRYYGNSAQWWRIAEANPLVFPLDLRPGTALIIPAPDALGRIERTRRF
jgi:nucleoid-associated protein YgaU